MGHAGGFQVLCHAGGFVDAVLADLAVAEAGDLVGGVHDLVVVAEVCLDFDRLFRALEVAALLDVRVVLRVVREGRVTEEFRDFLLRDAHVPERLVDDVHAVLFGEDAVLGLKEVREAVVAEVVDEVLRFFRGHGAAPDDFALAADVRAGGADDAGEEFYGVLYDRVDLGGGAAGADDHLVAVFGRAAQGLFRGVRDDSVALDEGAVEV